MRGDDLLLAHLTLLSEPDAEEAPTERPSATERLDSELGPDFARQLVAALTARERR